MTFEYWTFGNAAAIVQLLNAIAAIMAPASGIMGAVRSAAVIAFLMVVAGAVLRNNPMPVMQWLIGLAIIWYVAFVPRVTVLVMDETPATTRGYTVDNVPLGFALVASSGSMLNRWLTVTGETAFALPEGAKLHNAGLMQPHRITLASTGYTMPDSTLDSDWQSFFHECTYYDLNVYSKRLGHPGIVSHASLKAATDPLTELGKTNNVLFVHIVTDGPATVTCMQAYDILARQTRALAGRATVQDYYARQAFPNLSLAEARNAYTSALNDAQIALTMLPKTALDTIVNRWVVNMLKLRDTRSAIASGNTALAMVEFGAIQAEQQRLNAYLQSARAAVDTIPTIRNIIEAICIGLFPVVIIMTVLMGLMGMRIIMEWAMLFLSLQFWGFAYALLNFVMISKTAKNIYAIATGADAITISYGNVSAITEEITADMAMAGNLAWAIPIICYGLVRGLGAAGAMMATSMMAPAKSTAEAAGTQQGAGNYQLGFGRFSQVTAPNTVSIGDSAGTSTYHSGSPGAQSSFNPYYRGADGMRMGDPASFQGYSSSAPGISANAQQIQAASQSYAADKAESNARSMSTAAQSMQSAATAQVVSAAVRKAQSAAQDSSWSQGMTSSTAQGASATSSLVNDISSATGADQKTATQLLANAGLGGSVNTPMFSANLSGAIQKQYGSEASAKFSESDSAKSSEQMNSALSFMQSAASSQSVRESVMGSSEQGQAVEGRMAQAAALSQESQASYQRADSLRQAAQATLSGQSSVSYDPSASNPALARSLSELSRDPLFTGGNQEQQMYLIQDTLAAHGFNSSSVPTPAAGAGELQARVDGMSGGQAATSGSLQSGYTTTAQGIAVQGDMGVQVQAAAAPTTGDLSAPDTSAASGDINATIAGTSGAIEQQQNRISGGQQALDGQVQPALPEVTENNNLYALQSQGAQVFGNALEDTHLPDTVRGTVEKLQGLTDQKDTDPKPKEFDDKEPNIAP